MAELQPPMDLQVNGGGGGVDPTTIPAEPAAGPPKRQRRPSVRLGEIGDQPSYDNHRRNKPQQWRYNSKDSKATKTRQLMNLSGVVENYETLDAGIEDKEAGKLGNNVGNNNNNINNNNIVSNNNNNHLGCGPIGGWKVRDLAKTKRGFSVSTKRVRTNWGSKMDGGDDKFEDEDEDDFDDADRYSDYDRDGSGSQLKDQDQSLNLSMDYGNNRDGVRVRVSDGVELDGPSDTDARNWNNSNLERNGVRVWLNQLGLGRYFPIFEVHEVDDEVLPLLTLEDLKDMGINAVGSRRKMFCSIQKLGKGFS